MNLGLSCQRRLIEFYGGDDLDIVQACRIIGAGGQVLDWQIFQNNRMKVGLGLGDMPDPDLISSGEQLLGCCNPTTGKKMSLISSSPITCAGYSIGENSLLAVVQVMIVQPIPRYKGQVP